MSIKSQSQQRFVNDNYRKGYDGIKWDRGDVFVKRDVVEPVTYGGRPLLSGVAVIGVVSGEMK